MISGTAQADVAVLVVSALKGEFEAGFMGPNGRTKEHVLLARSLGITQLIVAVNKMDGVGWDKARFEEVAGLVGTYLKQMDYKSDSFRFVPLSGLGGANLLENNEEKLKSWYTGPTLVQAIDMFKPAKRNIEKPFRLSITDVYKSPTLGVALGGKIETGVVGVGDKLLVMPLNEICTVKGILTHQKTTKYAVAGDNVDIGTVGQEISFFRVGNYLCDPQHPIKVTKKFRAQILIFATVLPLTKGYQFVLHTQSTSEPAVLSRLISVLDKTSGEVQLRRPRVLGEKQTAMVEITTQHALCLELYADYRKLGSITLRDQGQTIAAGLVTHITQPK
eukprot:TRINITY_DN4735_c0_g1_i1.p1 TRINITY_DN4735_c0_g1~~TRINITY_DN4735_c0_g1_i1.p1  ORF type:complete len:333 (-),score=37.10 TRINITY_DN4735_c0_g1_i1:60-1058(-)